jgi:catechol 2,3-dioxygenase-like lactoylglutathione lyase family enzyme
MAIQRVEAITYGVEDVPRCIQYFDDFGLDRLDQGATGATFRTLTNQIVHIRDAADAALPPTHEHGSTLRFTIWGVDSAAALEAVGTELSRDREVHRDASGTLRSVDESGLPIGFAVARPTAVKVEPHPVNVGGVGQRINRPFPRIERVQPLRLVHVVFHIRKDQKDRAAAFYQKRLGFRLSDRSVDAGDFMRCEGSQDHHNLLLLHRADRVEYNHVAFEVLGFDEIMIGGLHMQNCGWKSVRNPGRHFLGSNFHWFFENPCGGRTEFIADMDQLDERWVPRIFEKHPGESLWLFSSGR